MRYYEIMLVVSIIMHNLLGVSACQAGMFDSDVDVSAYASAEQMHSEAKKFKSPKWKVQLGQRVIDQMIVANEQLAILTLKNYNQNLRKDQIRVVDLKQGKTLWKTSLPDNAYEVSVIFASKENTILRFDFKSHTLLHSVNSKTGNKVWERKLPSSRNINVQALGKKYLVLAAKSGNNVEYQLVDFRSNKSKWHFSAEIIGESIPKIVMYKNSILIPGTSLISLKASTGKKQWQISNVAYDPAYAAPVLHADRLYIHTANKLFYRINPKTGKVDWKFKLSSRYHITSIDPGNKYIYLRGTTESIKSVKPLIMAVKKDKGRLKWVRDINDRHQIVSNLIEYRGRLLGASPTHLYAIQPSSGDIVYNKHVSESQLSVYPVILRLIGKNVVFIGEMTIAAYRATTGKIIYRKGITGISPAADLSAVEKSINRLRNKISIRDKQEKFTPTNIFGPQYQITQASANTHYRNSDWARSQGDYWEYKSEQMSGQIDNSFAKIYAGLALFEAALNLDIAIYIGILRSIDDNLLAQHKLIRHSILSSYPMMMTKNYVYRPTRLYNLTDPDAGDFLQITAINLKSGKRKKTTMSVPFKEYGLWIYVDEKKGLAYQQSLGLDYKGEKPPTSYLIAKPINLPK
ncbi:MAG: PQQ-binding-like beta-propeller repeat protein [Gammaproteobacteria bacterium]|nr:PQQ-binding-like beta-propeller repeat protein [Gammaproteobacteria bacterium]